MFCRLHLPSTSPCPTKERGERKRVISGFSRSVGGARLDLFVFGRRRKTMEGKYDERKRGGGLCARESGVGVRNSDICRHPQPAGKKKKGKAISVTISPSDASSIFLPRNGYPPFSFLIKKCNQFSFSPTFSPKIGKLKILPAGAEEKKRREGYRGGWLVGWLLVCVCGISGKAGDYKTRQEEGQHRGMESRNPPLIPF